MNNKYKTIEEASIAAIKLLDNLSIHKRSASSYRQHYKNDPKLPSSPETYYTDFNTWLTFLGTDKSYPTAKETLESFRNLIGKAKPTKSAYLAIYQLDTKLPKDPELQYNLPHWQAFLWQRFYQSWQEASKAALYLLKKYPLTKSRYIEHYKQDPKLPSNPDKHYSDFPGWSTFLAQPIPQALSKAELIDYCYEHELWTLKSYLEKAKYNNQLPKRPVNFYGHKSYAELLKLHYFSLAETRQYCALKRIRNLGEYKSHARNHPRLKVNPTQIDQGQ